MATTILDVKDAAHSASMDVRAWAEEWMKEWMRPVQELEQARAEDKVRMFLDSLPPEALEAALAQMPANVRAKAVKRIAEIRKPRTK